LGFGEKEKARRQFLEKIREEFPKYRNDISSYDKIGGVRFSVSIRDLTEEQLRAVLQMFPGE
jgi:hypothetical protein